MSLKSRKTALTRSFGIGVEDIDKAIKTLHAKGFNDFTIEEGGNEIKLLRVWDSSLTDEENSERADKFDSNLDILIEELKGNGNFRLQGSDGRTKAESQIVSRYLTRKGRKNLYEAWHDTGEGAQNGELRDLLSQAHERIKRVERSRSRRIERLKKFKSLGRIDANEREKQTGDRGIHEVGVHQGGGDSQTQRDPLELHTAKTQNFFSNAVNSAEDTQPTHPWQPDGLDEGQQKAYDVWKDFDGGFSRHIDASIPRFREIQLTKAAAISKYLQDGQSMIDLGGSQGDFSKRIC